MHLSKRKIVAGEWDVVLSADLLGEQSRRWERAWQRYAFARAYLGEYLTGEWLAWYSTGTYAGLDRLVATSWDDGCAKLLLPSRDTEVSP